MYFTITDYSTRKQVFPGKHLLHTEEKIYHTHFYENHFNSKEQRRKPKTTR